MTVAADGKRPTLCGNPITRKKFRTLRAFIKNPRAIAGIVILSLFTAIAIFAPLLAHYDPQAPIFFPMQPPSAAHWLGATSTGQDLFAQFVWGTQTTMMMGIGGGLIMTILGVTIGTYAGYKGGATDAVLNVIANIFLVLPTLALLIVIESYMFPLRKHRKLKNAALPEALENLLEQVGLTPVAETRTKFPHELSGGQRQRVAIARVLAVNPKFLVADEPISMLYVSIRAGILRLMNDLKADYNLSYLYITHDLASARYFGDRIMVLYRGKIVETAISSELLRRPTHPYTRLLLAATPGFPLIASIFSTASSIGTLTESCCLVRLTKPSISWRKPAYLLSGSTTRRRERVAVPSRQTIAEPSTIS